jgi:PIN domain nuclease of toxin-antitoxin system
MFRTDIEISINYQQKKLQKKIDKLNYLNNLSEELQIKYNNILTSFNNIIELNSNHTNFNTLKTISKINTLTNGLIKEINESDLRYNIISEEMNISGKQKQLNNQESIVKWFNDSIIEKKGTKVRRSILYANYVSYCKENDLLPMIKSEVFLYIHKMMDTLVKNKGYHYFNGYELKN